jgi:hypothetical protein
MAVDALSNCVEETPASKLPPSLVPYQSFFGSLLHASVSTRPDITIAVIHLSMYMFAPSQSHWEQAKRVLCCVKGTVYSVLMYGATPSTKLVGWSDSNYANDVNGWRSRTWYVFMLNGASVSWNNYCQQIVAFSTAEAEYMALTTATQEARRFKQLLY